MLGVERYGTLEFAQQCNVNAAAMWGVAKTFLDVRLQSLSCEALRRRCQNALYLAR